MFDSPYETVTTTRHFFSVFGGCASDRNFEIDYDEFWVCIYELYGNNDRIHGSWEAISLQEGKWAWEDDDSSRNYFGYKNRFPVDYMAAILDHVNTHGIPKEIQKEMEESENS
jgi:hypothetical protein